MTARTPTALLVGLASLLWLSGAASAVPVCTTFATGVCCTGADGTNCKSPSVVCNSNATCAGQAPYTICAGAAADDAQAASTASGSYGSLAFNQCFSTAAALVGVSRSFSSGTYSVHDGLLQWDTSSLPDDATVTSATLTVRVSTVENANARNFQGEWFNWGPSCNAPDWTVSPASTAFDIPNSSIVANADNAIALTGPAGNVDPAGRSFLRLHESGGQPTGVNRVILAAYDNTTQPGPRLSVCYTVPTPDATPTATSTPTSTPAPSVDAGPDQNGVVGQSVLLQGSVSSLSPLDFWVGDTAAPLSLNHLLRYSSVTGVTLSPQALQTSGGSIYGWPSDLVRINGVVYGIDTFWRRLYTIDLATALVTPIIPSPNNNPDLMSSLAYDATNDVLYVSDYGTHAISTFNRSTGVATSLLQLPLNDVQALEYVDGVLYGIDNATQALYSFLPNPSNPQLTFRCSLPFNAGAGELYDELTYFRGEFYGGFTYFVGSTKIAQVRKIDIVTGQTTDIGPPISNSNCHSLLINSLPEDIQWSAVSGPGDVTFADPSNPQSSATFSEPGTYVLTLTVSADPTPLTDSVTVTVFSPTATPSVTNTPTPTAGATDAPTSSPTDTPTAVDTQTATGSETATATGTITMTQVSTPTETPTAAATETATSTNTPTATATALPVWPIDPFTAPPGGGYNDYGTYSSAVANAYHTGMDIGGQANPCLYNTPVFAGVSGSVALIQELGPCATPPSGTCAGTGCADGALGQTVVVRGDDGLYRLYGHLDSIAPGLTVGQPVTATTQVGVMGNSAGGVSRRGFCPGVPNCPTGSNFAPHLHFEVKTAAVLGAPANPPVQGYTFVGPPYFGYRDPVQQLEPLTPMQPAVVQVLVSQLNVRPNPGVQLPSIGTVAQGTRFVAFERRGSWFHIHLAATAGKPLEGWIAENDPSCANGQCSAIDTNPATIAVVVKPAATGGVNSPTSGVSAMDQPTTAGTLLARLWEGQAFVTLATAPQNAGEDCIGQWASLQSIVNTWACTQSTAQGLLLETTSTPPCYCQNPGMCESAAGATCSGGVCQYPAATGSSCDDGDSCTANDTCDAQKQCAGTSFSCNSPGPCQTGPGVCNGSGCDYPSLPTGTACDDESACTSDDQCTAQHLCVGTPQCDACQSCDPAEGICNGPVCTATPTATATPTSTPTAPGTPIGQVCTTFATGMCCTGADGTNCKSPAVLCSGSSTCTAQAPYSVCAGAAADGAQAASTTPGTYAGLTFGQCFSTATSLGVNRSSTGGTYAVNDGLLQWDTSALPDNAVVNSATLTVRVSNVDNANARDFQGEWFSWGASCDSSDWSVTAASTAFSRPNSSIIANADNSIALTALAGNINLTGRTSLRLHESGGQPTGLNRVVFADYGNTTQPGPRLQVCYVVPDPTQTPSPTATATETPTESPSTTPTESPTPTSSDIPEGTATDTTTPTDTPTPALTDTPTLTASPTETDSITATPTSTVTQVPTPSPTPTATQTATATPSGTATATATPIGTFCTTFATGVCCTSADGTDCKLPAAACTSNATCAAQVPYTVCAGATADGAQAGSTSTASYGSVAFSQCFATVPNIGVGRNFTGSTYSVNNGLVQWNTSTLPDDAIVTSAAFIINVSTRDDADGRALQGEWLNWGAACDVSDWTMAAASTAFSFPNSSIVANADNSIPLNGTLNDISLTGRTALRLHQSGGQPTGLNRVVFADYDHATKPGPRLQVCYALPTPTP